MKSLRTTLPVALTMVTTALVSTPAWAQAVDRPDLPAPAAQPPPPPEPDDGPDEPPREQTGFQLAFRTGVAVPAGKIASGAGNAQNDVFGVQVPLLLELGGKPLPGLFLGVYVGAGFGGVASEFAKQCASVGVSCSADAVRIGIEAIAYLRPGAWVDPWLGYGIGYESTTLVGEKGKAFATQSLSGFELAHFMAGFDVRISHSVGLGPYVDVAVGRYGHIHRVPPAVNAEGDTDIDRTAFHEWITLGARIVAFP